MKAAKKEIWRWTAATLAVLAVFCTWRPELGRKGQALIVLAGGALTAVLLWIDREIRKKEWKPEQIFLMLFIPISLAMMIALPLFRVPDEAGHLGRIWQISIGQWMPDDRNAGVFYQPVGLFEEDSTDMTLWQMAKTAGGAASTWRGWRKRMWGRRRASTRSTTIFRRRSEWRWFGW